ncbi:MAG: LamG domain-containing protein [Planctomycetota bacterium]|jgi:hypothetical protein
MCRKSVYLTSFVLMLCVTAGVANAFLVAYWPMDEGSGTTVRDATGTWDGTVTGSVTSVEGKDGMALEFPGGDNYVNFGNVEIGSDLTVAYWCFNPEKAYERPIGQHSGDYTADPGWCVFSRNEAEGNVWFRVHGADNAWNGGDIIIPDILSKTEWYHLTFTFDGTTRELKGYLNGELKASNICEEGRSIGPTTNDLRMGNVGTGEVFAGMLDEVAIWNHVLTEDEILAVMEGHIGGANPYAYRPDPDDGALHTDTWVTLSWKPGAYTVSHDIYMGDNFDDVNNATRDTELFRGSQPLGTDFYIAGFFGYAYPDGLVNGTTYYWRIDEVNDAEPNSPWKGDVWSFLVPPKTAYYPEPADNAEFVDINVQLTWTAGFGAKLHYVVFGEDFDEVNNATDGILNATTNYSPGPLKLAKTYYWRVDESDGFETFKGQVWSFTTEGAPSNPNPADGAVDVKPSVVLGWDSGSVAASYDMYLGTEEPLTLVGTVPLPENDFALPEPLDLETTYYWRVDGVNDINPDSPWTGKVWSFTTGDYFVIDDFEDYDAVDNQIWFSWHDGLGYGTPGTDPYFAGNGTGAAVGDETTASYTEETIVYGGDQSMPFTYDNNKQGSAYYSEVKYTLADQRDWTAEGVVELSLWFRGYPVSTGGFIENPVGTYTMTGSGTDIWDNADEFHFAHKMLTGVGSIVARVVSVENTNTWAKAGVMIRESLDPGSVHAMMIVTPEQGISFQRRLETNGASTHNTTGEITAPYWVKIERDIAGNFTAYSSANGSTWEMQGMSENIQMSSNVYIGLAVTAHNASETCEAVFTNVTTAGSVGPQWASQDVGILSNDAEPLYVAVSNTAGAPAIVVHGDVNAAQIDTWTEWIIPLQTFTDQGIVLTDVDSIAIGLGNRDNMTVPGGSGKMYIDDIRLYRPREAAE